MFMKIKVALLFMLIVIVVYAFSAGLGRDEIEEILKVNGFKQGIIDNLLSNISRTPFFFLASTKQSTVTWAVSFTIRTYSNPQEIIHIQNACFDSAIYYSIMPVATNVVKNMTCDPRYKESLITYITEKVLFARIKKFGYEKMGTYDGYVYAIVNYDNTNIYDFNSTFDSIKDGFAQFLYEEAFTDLVNKNIQGSFILFQALYSLNDQYSNDSLSFMAFIEIEKGDLRYAQHYLKMIDVSKLTINGLRICGRIYDYLGQYNIASYFYSEVLKLDPNNNEAEAYFNSLNKMREKESQSFFEGIKIGD